MEKMRGGDRPPFEKYYIIVFVVIFAFLVADLGNLFARRYLIPDTIPPKKMTAPKMAQNRNHQFPGIIARNIFNADGVIPPTQSELQGGGTGDDNDPRPSSLALDLVGTLVHADPAKSVATINLRGQNKIEPFMVDEEISGMARITQILRQRVVFRNLQNQLLEYIDIPADAGMMLSLDRGATMTVPKQQEEKTQFEFPRAEINAQLENLPALLQQARVVPETGPDGQVRCYKMVELQAGSIFEKLGLRMGDCLSAVNGEPINSPQKAMEMYQMLRESPDIKLSFDRGGRNVENSYQIR